MECLNLSIKFLFNTYFHTKTKLRLVFTRLTVLFIICNYHAYSCLALIISFDNHAFASVGHIIWSLLLDSLPSVLWRCWLGGSRPWNRSSRTNRLNSTENRPTRSIDSTFVDSVDRLDSAENRSTRSIDSTRFPLFIGLLIFRCAISVEQRVFHRHVCLSVTTMYCARGY